MKLNAALFLSVLATTAHAGVLDFDYTVVPLTTADSSGLGPSQPLNSSGWISQAYGDVAGVVNVSYRYIDSGGNATTSLQTWTTGYDELTYPAWTGNSAGGDRAQVELASVGGSSVTLTSFRLGSWESAGLGRSESVRVYEIGNPTAVYSFDGLIGAANLSNLFAPGGASGLQSNTGFVIEWTSPWWTAIDTIDSSAVSAVPEPGSWVMLGLGLAALVLRAGRRGAASA